MRRLTLLTAASTQTLSVQEVIDRVLANLVESLGATHGIIRLIEGEGKSAQLTVRASVGFAKAFLVQYAKIPLAESWVQQILKGNVQFVQADEEQDMAARQRIAKAGLKSLVTLALPGKEGALGVIALGSTRIVKFQSGELSYLLKLAILLGMTLQKARLFEQVNPVQKKWEYTFASIGA